MSLLETWLLYLGGFAGAALLFKLSVKTLAIVTARHLRGRGKCEVCFSATATLAFDTTDGRPPINGCEPCLRLKLHDFAFDRLRAKGRITPIAHETKGGAV